LAEHREHLVESHGGFALLKCVDKTSRHASERGELILAEPQFQTPTPQIFAPHGRLSCTIVHNAKHTPVWRHSAREICRIVHPVTTLGLLTPPYACSCISRSVDLSPACPLLSREALQARVTDYTAGQDPALGLISPIFADLSGLPPLIIQAGTHEVLLDDAVRLARQAATADVEVTLDITPGVPHVFQAYYQILDEAAAALDRAGQFLSAHLVSAERVTA
jgi:hypothetical protein